jgi:glucokinase
VGITLGTGLGIGMVIEGRLYEGSHGNAGQIWNTPMDGTLRFLMDDRCGRTIERSYRSNAGRALSSVEIADLAEQGDEAAGNAFEAFGKAVGLAVAFIVNIVDPEVVVFGGSIARSFEHFIRPLAEVVDGVTQVGDTVRLERSALGDSAVLLGAARMFWERCERLPGERPPRCAATDC